MKTAFLLAMLAFIPGWAPAQEATGQTEPAAAIEQILANMPENSDRRCMGISLVAAALLEGQRLDGEECDQPQDLGKRVYEAVFTKGRVQWHSKLCIGADRVSITSREGLNVLATIVADRYKQRYFELIASAEGRKKLRDIEKQVLDTRRALEQLLDADADHIAAFALVGERRFPDGAIKDTNHVILIAKKADDEIVVYDPNEPGRPIPCRFLPSSDGVMVSWTCRYRDTGFVTTQQYRIIEINRLFREALARD
jgi:hypothetical protein